MRIFGLEIIKYKKTSPDKSLLGKGKQTTISFQDSLTNVFRSRRFHDHHRYDLTKYANLTAEKLLDILIDSNPDISQALYSFLRMCNSGYSYKVVKPNGKPFKEGQNTIDRWIKNLELQQTNKGFKEDRSLNSLVNKIHLSFFVKGAASCEIALDKRIQPNYIDIVDPYTIYFKRKDNELIPYQSQSGAGIKERKQGQWEGNYKKIDIPSFFYQPLDARLNDVYGVCPILPALQVVFFQIQVLQDLQTVLHKAGYPRLEVKLLEEILIKNAPPTIRNDSKKLAQWLTTKKSEIETEYQKINPDDALIHFDSVEVKYLETSRGLGTFDARALVEIIDSQVIASLKTLSTLMGRHRGRTETYASAEVQLYIKGVEAVQKVSGLLMSRLLTFCLNMFGLQGYVEFGYLPIELRSKTELAQWDAVRIKNHLIFIALGMESFEDACIELTGHKPTGKVNADTELLLALLNVNYPQAERSSDADGNKEAGKKDKNNINTVDDLLAKINGKK